MRDAFSVVFKQHILTHTQYVRKKKRKTFAVSHHQNHRTKTKLNAYDRRPICAQTDSSRSLTHSHSAARAKKTRERKRAKRERVARYTFITRRRRRRRRRKIGKKKDALHFLRVALFRRHARREQALVLLISSSGRVAVPSSSSSFAAIDRSSPRVRRSAHCVFYLFFYEE